MPPSGYSQPAVNGLVTFFATTLADLRAEVADGKHANLETGCTFEVDQIEKVLASKPNIDAGTELHSVASASVGAQLAYTWLILAMTLTFYRRVWQSVLTLHLQK